MQNMEFEHLPYEPENSDPRRAYNHLRTSLGQNSADLAMKMVYKRLFEKAGLPLDTVSLKTNQYDGILRLSSFQKSRA